MRIGLDKTRILALLVALHLVLPLAFAGWYFFFVRPTRGVGHEPWMMPDTAVRVVLKPALVQSYVSSLAAPATRFVPGVPKVSSLQQFSFRSEWIHKMPFEFTLLFDQRSPERQGVLLFVREHPTAESFERLVNDSGFFHALYPIQWEQQRMARQDGGDLLAGGVLPIPPATREAVSQAWPNYAPFAAAPVTGKHFIEIGVINRNGALMELHGALSSVTRIWADAALEQRMYQAWPDIEQARLTADLTANDTLRFEVVMECLDSAAAGAVAATLEMAVNAANRYLGQRHSFLLHGTTNAANSTVRGVYTLSGFERPLRRALGG